MLSDDERPSGKYAEQMIANAWSPDSPRRLSSVGQDWNNEARAQQNEHERQTRIARELQQHLQSDGFDALHEERKKVVRNREFLKEDAHSFNQLYEQLATSLGAMKMHMRVVVAERHQIIDQIESNPLIEPDEQKALVDAIVEETNAELIAANASVTQVAAAQFARISAAAQAQPYYVSKSDSSPSTPHIGSKAGATPVDWTTPRKDKTGGETPEQGGPTGSNPRKATDGQLPNKDPAADKANPRKPGSTDHPSSKTPGVGSAAGKGLDNLPTSNTPAPTSTPGTSGSTGMTMPSTGAPGGGGVPGGSGLSSAASPLGSLGRGVPPVPNQLAPSTPPVSPSSVNPLAGAPAAASAASSARPAVPLSAQVGPTSTPATSVAAPATTGAAQVGATTPAQVQQAPLVGSVGGAPNSGTLGPAPALSGPPPNGAVTPPGPAGSGGTAVGSSGGGSVGPTLAPGLPVVGTPLIRDGVIERAEDPDIVRARDLIFQLLWAGRRYPSLDWAIGIHRVDNESRFYITSSEGLCYIPQHVFLPNHPSLGSLFIDREVVRSNWSVLWQGWVDPSRTVAMHSRLRAEFHGYPTLFAIVSSNQSEDLSHLIAKETRLEFCNPEKNPFADPARAMEIPELGPSNLHRLATVAPDLYEMVRQIPEDFRWSAAIDLITDAVSTTNVRHVMTGVVTGPDVPVDDPHARVLEEVLDMVHAGIGVDADTWARVNMAYWTAVMQAQSARHTTHELSDDSGYVDLYRRARAYEGAQQLNVADGPLLDTWLADVAYNHLCATDSAQRTGNILYSRIPAGAQ